MTLHTKPLFNQPDGDEAISMARLFTWLSPSFPIGAYSYSYGIESAVADRTIVNGDDLAMWLADTIAHGTGFADAVFCGLAWANADDQSALRGLKGECEAFASCRERHQETLELGNRFLSALRPWTVKPHAILQGSAPFPIAFGVTAHEQGADQSLCLILYLQSLLSNLTQAGMRMGICGQDEAMGILSDFENALRRCAQRAQATALEDLASATIGAEIYAMRHGELYSRIHQT